MRRCLLLSAFIARASCSTDVVIAHHDEDLAWLSSVQPPPAADKPRLVVYTKGEEGVRLPDGLKMAGEVRPLPNVGRESHSFLSHIVENYDSLADWTVFTQAAAPSFGYRGHRSGGGHLLAGDSFEDYLTPTASGSRFIYTSVVELPSLHHVMRVSYCINDTRVEAGLERHEAEACPADGSAWTEWWEVGWLQSYLTSKVEAQGGEMPLDFYREYIDADHKERQSVQITFAQGARFALSRDTILRRPKADYARVLATLSLDEDPYSGYYMEWMWGELFLGHTAPCKLPPSLPEDATPTSHQNAMDRLAYRYYKGRSGQLLPAAQTPDVVPAQFRRRMSGDAVSGVSGLSGVPNVVSPPEEVDVVSTPEPVVSTPEPEVSTPEPEVSTPEPEVSTPEPTPTPETASTDFYLDMYGTSEEAIEEVTTPIQNQVTQALIDGLSAELSPADEPTGATLSLSSQSTLFNFNVFMPSADAVETAATLTVLESVFAAALAAGGLSYIEGSFNYYLCIGVCYSNVKDDGDGGLSGGAIAGIVVGTVFGAGAIGGGTAYFLYKKKQKQVGVY